MPPNQANKAIGEYHLVEGMTRNRSTSDKSPVKSQAQTDQDAKSSSPKAKTSSSSSRPYNADEIRKFIEKQRRKANASEPGDGGGRGRADKQQRKRTDTSNTDEPKQSQIVTTKRKTLSIKAPDASSLSDGPTTNDYTHKVLVENKNKLGLQMRQQQQQASSSKQSKKTLNVAFSEMFPAHARSQVATRHQSSVESALQSAAKHDRLTKICSIALELQAKLEQTKLTLVNLAGVKETAPVAATLLSKDDISSILTESRQKMNMLESMWSTKNNSINKTTAEVKLEPEQPTENSVQLAFKRFKQTGVQIVFDTSNIERNQKDAAAAAAAAAINEAKHDEYNFINIYTKRKSLLTSANEAPSPNNNNNNNNNNMKANNQVLAGRKASLSTSTADSTTSLSKYLSASKKKTTTTTNDNKQSETATDNRKTPSAKFAADSPHHSKRIINDATNTSASDSSAAETSDSETLVSKSTAKVDKKERLLANSSSEEEEEEELLLLANESKRSTAKKPTATLAYSPNISTLSTVHDSFSVTRPLSVAPPAPPVKAQLKTNKKESTASRYSPSSLERMLNVGLNYLDTLASSQLHLEELDKARCVGLGQQETVALAAFLTKKPPPPLSSFIYPSSAASHIGNHFGGERRQEKAHKETQSSLKQSKNDVTSNSESETVDQQSPSNQHNFPVRCFFSYILLIFCLIVCAFVASSSRAS